MSFHEALSIDHLLLGASGLLILSILASKVSTRFGVPALVFFLVIGMLAGSDGPGGIHFNNAWLAKSLGVLALSVILFAGGLSTDWASVRPVLWRGISLSTVGVVVTAVLMAFFSQAVLGFSILEGFLLGAIVSSTDAAAVFTVLKSKSVSLKRDLQPLLEFESGSNDPMSVFLTLGFIALIQRPEASALLLLPMLLQQVAVGSLTGWLMGRAMIWVMNRLKLDYDGLYPVLILCLSFFAYGASASLGGNGFLTVYLSGLMLAKAEFPYKKSLVRFHDGMAWLMQIAMFLTLGLLVFPSRIIPILVPGLMACAFLMLAARPIGVFVSLAFARMHSNEKRMIAWVGLRGAAPIVLATFALLAGVPRSDYIFNIVFFVVLASVLLQGTSIPYVAKLLKVDAPLEKKRRYPIEFEQTRGVSTDLAEFIVPYNSAVAGEPVRQLGLPAGSLITMICRGDEFIVASGATVLEEGDIVLALVDKENVKQVQVILSRQKQLPL